jgi:AcrR family transcriptional regulator
VLSANGYAGLRLTDVAAQAEIQAPAIYYYYASRDELIEEVMWAGIADMREHVAAVLNQLPDGRPPLDRLLAATEAHLRHALEISDYTTASIRNAGQVPLSIRKRQILEEERYGELWRRLINDLAVEGRLRPELDMYIAQMLVLGALNWAVEWWDPRRACRRERVLDQSSQPQLGWEPDQFLVDEISDVYIVALCEVMVRRADIYHRLLG